MGGTARKAHKRVKEDQLVTSTMRFTEWAQAHFNQVIIGIVALVALVAVLVFAANSRESSAREAERVMGAGMTLMMQGDYNAAMASFQQVVERHGGTQAAAASYFKAECESNLGNYEQAVSDYDAYLSASAKYPVFEAAALSGKAMCLEAMKSYAEAAKTMAAAVAKLDAKDPRYGDAALSAGDLYTAAGQSQDALTYYKLAAEHGTGDVKARANVAVDLIE